MNNPEVKPITPVSKVLEALAHTDTLILNKLIEMNNAHNQLYNSCVQLSNIIKLQTEKILALERAVQQMIVPSLS